MPILEDSAISSRQIQKMFNKVAPRYDLLNKILSIGRDRYWRKAAVDLLAVDRGDRFLDVATGTADVALEMASRHPGKLRVFGIDFSSSMLELAQKKIRARNRDGSIALQIASGENLPFANGSFDGVIIAFGIRNFSNPLRGLEEMRRVLKADGRIVVLEFSHPTHPVLGRIYRFYFNFILPRIGKMISPDKGAYSYLPASVWNFSVRSDFVGTMQKAGFTRIKYKDLTWGIVTLFFGNKYA